MEDDAVAPTFTYTHSALANGDNDSGFTGALARGAGENVRSYAINRGSLSAGSNYSLSLSAPTVYFAITAKPVTITPNSAQSKVYGAADPTVTYTHGALANGDSDSVFTGALARGAGENVGSYAINLGSLSAGSNYSLSLSAPTVTFAITAKPVTITPNSAQSKVYGAADPTVTYTHSALANGDSNS